MRYALFALLFLTLAVYAHALPSYEGYVTDQAKLFSPAEKVQLEQVLTQIEENTTAEVAIVTVENLEGLAIEDYSIQLAEQWKVGKKDTDNGLIILIAPNERKYRIEVGYGLEGTLPDSLVGRLGREILVPAFKEQKYGAGVLELTETLQGYLENNPEIISRHELSTFNLVVMWLIVMVFIAAFGLIFYYGIQHSVHKGKGGKGGTGGLGGVFWGGGRNGGSSGGFGGFGGGGFGGGGGSGGW